MVSKKKIEFINSQMIPQKMQPTFLFPGLKGRAIQAGQFRVGNQKQLKTYSLCACFDIMS